MWLWMAAAAVAGMVAGLFIGWRMGVSAMQPAVQQLNRNLANDRNFVLSVLRRELANWMFRRDPDRYLRTYKKAHEAAAAISVADRSDQRGQLAKLTEEHGFYRDFDLLGTHDYVLYGDALRSNPYDEVERHYTDIIRFQALQIAIDENWSDIYPSVHPTSEAELAHLEKYVQRFKDTLFKDRLKDAIHEFHGYQSNTRNDDLRQGLHEYKTAAFSLRRVPHSAETRYGIHFNDSDEFGLYTIFYAEDRDQPYIGFYRSDARFETEVILDDIPTDEPI